MVDLGNDLFANAVVLTGTLASNSIGPFTNVGYGKESGEGGNAGSTAWFVWYPDPSLVGTSVSINNIGSGYDCYLGLWSAPLIGDPAWKTVYNVTNITFVNQSDDGFGSTGRESQVTFTVASNTMYFIQDGGFSTNQSTNNIVNYPKALPVASASKYGLDATASYGVRSYGGSQRAVTAVPLTYGFLAAGKASVTNNKLDVARYADDIALEPSTPTSSDIVLEPSSGTSGLSTTVAAGASASLTPGVTYATKTTINGKAVMSFVEGTRYSTTASGAGVASVTTALTVIRSSKTNTNIWAIQSPGGVSNIQLEADAPPDSMVATAAGQSTVTITLGRKQPVSMTSTGVAGGNWNLGKFFYFAEVSAGAGAFLSNNLQVIKGTDYVTIYPQHPPYLDRDVLIAGKAGPGVAQGFQMISNGVASMTQTPGIRQKLQATSSGVATMAVREGQIYGITTTMAGVGHLTNYLSSRVYLTATSAGRGGCTNNSLRGQQFLASTTSHGIAAFTANYLSSPIRLTSTSAGRAGCTSNYMAGPVPYTATSNGVGHMVDYLGTPVRLTTTSAGRAGCTSNYLSAPIRLVSTSAGRAGCTSNYLSSPVRGFTATSHGVAGGSWYAASHVYLYASFMNGRASFTNNYLAGPVTLTTTSHGVASAVLALPYISANAHGVGTMSDSLIVGGNAQRLVCNAGCIAYDSWLADYNPAYFPNPNNLGRTGKGGVTMYQTGTTYMQWASHGSSAGTQMDKPPFALVCNAGCRAFGNPVYGVIIYLSSPMRWGAGSWTSSGRGSMYFPPEFKFVCNAGCNAYDMPPAPDLNLANIHYPRGTGPWAPEVIGGVFFYQTGVTYMAARTWDNLYWQHQTGSYYYPPDHWYMSSHVKLFETANGVCHFTINERFSDVTYFDGKGGCSSNYINIASYGNMLAESDGVATMTMYGAGRTEMAFKVNAGAKGFRVYSGNPFGGQYGDGYIYYGVIANESGTVYLTTQSDGVSGPNSIDPYFQNEQATAHAGCYPYVTPGYIDPISGENIPAVHHPQGVEATQTIPAIGINAIIHGIANVHATMEGAPVYDLFSHGVGRFRTNADAIIRNMAANIHGIATMGATAYQPHDWQADGIGHMFDTLTYALTPSWRNYFNTGPPGGGDTGPFRIHESGAEGHMYVAKPPELEMKTETNLYKWDPAHGYVSRGTPLYTPDAWHMVVNWALMSRARGRTKFDATMYLKTVYGDLLHRYWQVQRPDLPNIDGDSSQNPGHGQYWPRMLKLPFRSLETPYPFWYDFEYWRR